MKRFASMGTALLLAVLPAYSQTKSNTVFFSEEGPQFHINTSVGNTPTLRFYLYDLAELPTLASNYVWRYRWSTNPALSDVTYMGTLTGTVYAAGTSTNAGARTTNYVEFTSYTTTFTIPKENGFAVLMSQQGTTGQLSYVWGRQTVKAAPEWSAGTLTGMTAAVQGDLYGPFSGDFSGWPFLSTGSTVVAGSLTGLTAGAGISVAVSGHEGYVTNTDHAGSVVVSNWVTALQGDVANVSGRVVTVEGEMNAIQADTLSISTALDVAEAILLSTSNELDALQADVLAESNRLSSVSNDMWGALGVVSGRVDAVDADHDGLADGVEAAVTNGYIKAGDTIATSIYGPNATATNAYVTLNQLEDVASGVLDLYMSSEQHTVAAGETLVTEAPVVAIHTNVLGDGTNWLPYHVFTNATDVIRSGVFTLHRYASKAAGTKTAQPIWQLVWTDGVTTNVAGTNVPVATVATDIGVYRDAVSLQTNVMGSGLYVVVRPGYLQTGVGSDCTVLTYEGAPYNSHVETPGLGSGGFLTAETDPLALHTNGDNQMRATLNMGGNAATNQATLSGPTNGLLITTANPAPLESPQGHILIRPGAFASHGQGGQLLMHAYFDEGNAQSNGWIKLQGGDSVNNNMPGRIVLEGGVDTSDGIQPEISDASRASIQIQGQSFSQADTNHGDIFILGGGISSEGYTGGTVRVAMGTNAHFKIYRRNALGDLGDVLLSLDYANGILSANGSGLTNLTGASLADGFASTQNVLVVTNALMVGDTNTASAKLHVTTPSNTVGVVVDAVGGVAADQKLQSWRVAGSEKAYVDEDGDLYLSGNIENVVTVKGSASGSIYAGTVGPNGTIAIGRWSDTTAGHDDFYIVGDADDLVFYQNVNDASQYYGHLPMAERLRFRGNALMIPTTNDAVAPAAVTNYAQIFSTNSSSAELHVIDGGGNVTGLGQVDDDTGHELLITWNPYLGGEGQIRDLDSLITLVSNIVEELPQLKAKLGQDLPALRKSMKGPARDWDADQREARDKRNAAIEEWAASDPAKRGPMPDPYRMATNAATGKPQRIIDWEAKRK